MIHLDVDGANRRSARHHAKVTRQMLNRISGEQCHAIIGRKPARAQRCADASRELMKLPVAQDASIFGANNAGAVGMALRGPRDPIPKQLWTGLCSLHAVSHLRHSIIDRIVVVL
jgi:hypothetical protein